MNFEEVVCYSQTVILVLLAIGYIVSLRNKRTDSPPQIASKCPSCNYKITDEKVQYCTKCGNMLSHSEGLPLQKKSS